jgi:hypothetical protein
MYLASRSIGLATQMENNGYDKHFTEQKAKERTGKWNKDKRDNEKAYCTLVPKKTNKLHGLSP